MKSKKPMIPYLVWMAVFIVVPLGMVFYYAFTDQTGAFSLENAEYIVRMKDVYIESFVIAFLSTLICLILAYPFALVMSRMKTRSAAVMNMLLMLPMWMNFILRICAWLMILQPNGILDKFLSLLGMGGNTIYHSRSAVIIGIVYNYLPFMILPIYTTLSKISKSLIEAGQDLGCNGWKLLTKIIFPLSIPGVITGITMVFVPAASVFVISARLGGSNLIGDTIELYYKGAGANMHIGSMLSLVLMAVIVIGIAIMNHFDKDDDIVLA